jgi:hypothetical protein
MTVVSEVILISPQCGLAEIGIAQEHQPAPASQPLLYCDVFRTRTSNSLQN